MGSRMEVSQYRPADEEVAWIAYRLIRARMSDPHHALAAAEEASSSHALDVFSSPAGMDDALWGTVNAYSLTHSQWTPALPLRTPVLNPYFDSVGGGDYGWVIISKLV